MNRVRFFLGIFATLLLCALLASGPLLYEGVLHPLAHQRLAYLGTPVVLVYVLWSLVREWKAR